MAIYSAVAPPPGFGGSTTSASPLPNAQSPPPPPPAASVPASGAADIEAWTLSALQSLSVSPVASGISHPLAVPLDGEPPSAAKPSVRIRDPRPADAITPPRRPPSRRDSLKRREALLKGNEGSRQRRRWENDRLMHVPNAQPPQPFDWEPRPTHPVHHVPYQVAAAWELRVRADVEAKEATAARHKQQQTQTLGDDAVTGRVPRELFLRAKKTPAVRTWVRTLEEPVRQYLVDRRVAREAEAEESDDTEDEEIVFVGRNGSMRDGWKKARRQVPEGDAEEGIVFDALGDDDESGAFKRWLTHSISDYYGLDSRSVLVGSPSRKVVYIGLKAVPPGHAPPVLSHLPRPLWQLC